MKILECAKCGNILHKTDKCFYCGNKESFSELEKTKVHENVIREYETTIDLLKNGRFDEVLKRINLLLEWMPNSSEVYWLKLLASNKCKTDLDLIKHGFAKENSPEYINAIKHSTANEKRLYKSIGEKITAIEKELVDSITKHECESKLATGIVKAKDGIGDEIENYKKKIFELWEKLEEIEQKMYSCEKDCELITYESKIALKYADKKASQIKQDCYKLNECDENLLHIHQINLGVALQESADACKALNETKNKHPWIKKYKDLESERNKQVTLINSSINDFKNYIAEINSTLRVIENIDQEHNNAINSLKNGDFTEACRILGDIQFEQILNKIGIIY